MNIEQKIHDALSVHFGRQVHNPETSLSGLFLKALRDVARDPGHRLNGSLYNERYIRLLRNERGISLDPSGNYFTEIFNLYFAGKDPCYRKMQLLKAPGSEDTGYRFSGLGTQHEDTCKQAVLNIVHERVDGRLHLKAPS
jgi:hypothetical protein